MAVVVQIGVAFLAISPFSLCVLLGRLAFVASGPLQLFPEPCFSPAPLSREWNIC